VPANTARIKWGIELDSYRCHEQRVSSPDEFDVLLDRIEQQRAMRARRTR
jgi:hypothetical protein